jgi:hypothetical protein
MDIGGLFTRLPLGDIQLSWESAPNDDSEMQRQFPVPVTAVVNGTNLEGSTPS